MRCDAVLRGARLGLEGRAMSQSVGEGCPDGAGVRARTIEAEMRAMIAARDDGQRIMDEVYRVVVEKVRLKLETMEDLPVTEPLVVTRSVRRRLGRV